jgi:hypothetical protein
VTGRSFLLGLAIGILIGIYSAPIVARQDFGLPDSLRTVLPLSGLTNSALDAATWPSDKMAKSELFRISNWDISIHGTGSTVAVKRCISVGQDSIACELAARLGWVDGEKSIEAVFKGEPGNWRIVAAKSR